MVAKNDFAKWATDVYSNKRLTELFKKAQTKEQLAKALEDVIRPEDEKMEEEVRALKEQKADFERPQMGIDDEQFDEIREKYETKNEKIADRFDDVASRIEQSMKDDMPQETENRIDGLKSRYEDIRQKITDLRKQGKDMFIPSLMLRMFLGNLSVAIITREADDFKKIDSLLDEVEQEMRDSISKPVVDVKREVLMMAGIKQEKEA